jgi:hypothetical protein
MRVSKGCGRLIREAEYGFCYWVGGSGLTVGRGRSRGRRDGCGAVRLWGWSGICWTGVLGREGSQRGKIDSVVRSRC